MNQSEMLRDLRTKEDQLNQQLTDTQRRLEAIRNVIEIYEEEKAARANAVVPRNGTFTAQITAGVEAILREERPLHRTVILKRLVAGGLHVGGAKPLNTLGSYLSMGDNFKSDTSTTRKGFWTLVEEPVDADATVEQR